MSMQRTLAAGMVAIPGQHQLKVVRFVWAKDRKRCREVNEEEEEEEKEPHRNDDDQAVSNKHQAEWSFAKASVEPLPDTIHKAEWFVPGPKVQELECAVCLEVVADPPNLEICAHLICRACLEGCRQKGCETCPVDGLPLSVDCRFASQPFVQHLVSNLQVQCPRANCKWTGTYGIAGRNLRAHYEATCTLIPHVCNKCQEETLDTNVHTTQCPQRRVMCKHCDASYAHADLAAHQAPVNGAPCANMQQCSEIGCRHPWFPESRRAAHARGCSRRQVACTYCPMPHPIAFDELVPHLLSMFHTAPHSLARRMRDMAPSLG
jgi:hypothetical protein